MPVAEDILSDEDVGVSWGKPSSNTLTDEDVGVSWGKPASAPVAKKKSIFSLPTAEESADIKRTLAADAGNPEHFRSEPGMEDYERLSSTPIVPAGLIRTGIDIADAGLTQTLPKPAGQFASGLKQSAAEMAAAMTGPQGIATLPAFLVPVAREVLSLIMGGHAIGESSAEFLDAMEKGDWERAGKAAGNIAGGVGMAAPGVRGLTSRLLPEPIVESPPVILPDPDTVARNNMAPGTLRPEEIQRIGPPAGAEAPPMINASGIPFNRLGRFATAAETAPEILPTERQTEFAGRAELPQSGQQFTGLEGTPDVAKGVDERGLQVSREGAERGNETLPPNVLFRDQPVAEPPLPEAYRAPFEETPGVTTQAKVLEEQLNRRDMLELVKKLGETPASLAPKLIDELRGITDPQTPIRPAADEILFKTIISKLEEDRLANRTPPPEPPAGTAAAPPPTPPEIPPAIKAAVADAQAIGLKRSAAAAAKSIAQKPKPKESNASPEPSAASVPEPTLRPSVGEEAPLRQPGETPGARPTPEAAPAQTKGRAEAPRTEVPLTKAAQTVARIEALPEGEAIKLSQKAEMFRDLDLQPEDAKTFKAAAEKAFKDFAKHAEEGNDTAAQAAYGRGIFYNGAIEWANKKGPNFEASQAPKAPVEAPKVEAPPETPKPGDIESHLSERVPDVTAARERVQNTDKVKREMQEKHEAVRREIEALEKVIMPQRGSRYSRSQIKKSARQSDVTKYRELQKKSADMQTSARMVEEAVREDRLAVDRASSAETINKKENSLLQRIDRKIRLLHDQGKNIPKELEAARTEETARALREKYPDVTPEEIAQMAPEVQRQAYFGGDYMKSPGIPSLNAIRRARLDALVNDGKVIPHSELPEPIQERIQKARSGGANDTIPIGTLNTLEKDIRKAGKEYHARVEAERIKDEQERLEANLQEAKMMEEAQSIVDSQPRTRNAVSVKNDLLGRIMEKITKLVDDEGVTLRPQPEAPNEFIAETKDKGGFAFGTIEPKGKSFTVKAWRVGAAKEAVSTTVGTRAEAEAVIKGMAATGKGRTVVAVPGDGIYRLVNDGQKLLSVWRKAKGLDTSSGRGFSRPGGSGEAPPAEIRTVSDWREAKNYHDLQALDTVHDWSPALKALAEKVDPAAPEKVTVADINAFIEKKKAKPSDIAQKAADALREQLKTPDTGKELGTFGAVPKLINAAVELAAQIIERGGSLADAVGEAIDYVKRNHKGWFDEAGFRKFVEDTHRRAVPPAPPAPPVPPTPPRSGAPVPPAPVPPPAPGGAVSTLRSKVQAVRDYMTVDPIPKLTREMGEASQTAIEHAKARGAVPSMINNMLAKVFPDQFHDPAAMARTMDVLKKDDILGGYDDFVARANDAAARGDTREASKWRKLADSVGNVQDLAALARDVEAGRNDPVISANIRRWKAVVNPELDQLYNEMKGMDPNTPRDGRGRVFGARTNLLPRSEEARWQNALTGDESNPLPQQSASNYRNPNVKRDKFDRIAKLTGDYSDNPAAVLANVLFHRWNEVTKNRFFNSLVESGNASWEMPPGEVIKGQKVARLPVKVPETKTTMEGGTAIDSGTRQVERSLFVPENLVSEIRGVLGTDLNLKQHPVGSVLNKLQLYQLADFVAHTKNQIAAVANAPQMKGVFTELARRFPGVNVLDAVGRIGKAAFDISKDSPEIRAELDDMARKGLLREKTLYPETTLSKPLHTTHDFLFRNDTAMRLVMNRFYNTLVKNGLAPDSIVQRRKFVGQAGEYNSRLLGPMMRNFRSSGLSPFIVAGRNFNRFAIRRVSGNPGFTPTNTGASALLRGANVYTLAATVAVPMIVNYLTQGSFTGRPGTPLGAFDLGGKKDENGNHRVFDWAQIQGIRRGARITGLDAIGEGAVSGRDADEIIGKAVGASGQALAHPWVGPALGFVAQVATGKRLDLRSGPQPAEARNMGSPVSVSQKAENARVALKNQNRPLYGLIRPLVNDTEEGYFKDLLGDLGKAPQSAVGSRKAASPALDEARLLSITGTPVTPESAEKMKLKRKLVKDMVAGDDASTQKALDEGKITKRDATELENKVGTDPLTFIVHQHQHLSADQAMRVWRLATKEERAELFQIVADKVNRDQKSSEEKVQAWADELNKFQE